MGTTVIPMPIVIRSESQESKIERRAQRYSQDPELQRAYRDGAMSMTGGLTNAQIVLGVVLISFVFLQFISVILALIDQAEPEGKWRFVFPLMRPTAKFSWWMSK